MAQNHPLFADSEPQECRRRRLTDGEIEECRELRTQNASSDTNASEAAVSILDVWDRRDVATHLGTFISHAMHPKCKIRLFLNLRALSKSMCRSTMLPFIGRLNELSRTHAQKEVRDSMEHVILSGWTHQIYPRGNKYVSRFCRESRSTDLWLTMDAKTGLPQGMRQKYFDKCQSAKKVLGWRVGNGEIQLML